MNDVGHTNFWQQAQDKFCSVKNEQPIEELLLEWILVERSKNWGVPWSGKIVWTAGAGVEFVYNEGLSDRWVGGISHF